MDSQSCENSSTSKKFPLKRKPYTKRIYNEEFMALSFVRKSLTDKNNRIAKLKDVVDVLKKQVHSLKMECSDKSYEIEKLVAELEVHDINAMKQNSTTYKNAEYERTVDGTVGHIETPSTDTIQVSSLENIHNNGQYQPKEMRRIGKNKKGQEDAQLFTSHHSDEGEIQATLETVAQKPLVESVETATMENTPTKPKRGRPRRKSAVLNPFCNNTGGRACSIAENSFLAGYHVFKDGDSIKKEPEDDDGGSIKKEPEDDDADDDDPSYRDRPWRKKASDRLRWWSKGGGGAIRGASGTLRRPYIRCKPHPCPVQHCAFASDKPSNLERHLNCIHTGACPYKCQVPGCNANFPRKDYLLLHMRSEHPQLLVSCADPACTLLFFTEKEARVHASIRHPNIAYTISRYPSVSAPASCDQTSDSEAPT